uniref:Uncharacterized protein n=1 Tax=Oryza barthii TaxID=65489 RepID=A0A679BBH5_9ORYZ|nr:hypothetical protein [Oryza barthii]
MQSGFSLSGAAIEVGPRGEPYIGVAIGRTAMRSGYCQCEVIERLCRGASRVGTRLMCWAVAECG